MFSMMLVLISIFPSVSCLSGWMYISCGQRHTNPRRQDTGMTKFFTLVPDIFRFSVWNLLHVTLLVPYFSDHKTHHDFSLDI